jgi:hypothetical protein
MKASGWVVWLSVITILLTAADCAVHIVEVTTTADVLGRLSPDYSGITDLRRAFAAQSVWTAVSGWIILSQLGIIVMIARLRRSAR